MVVVKPQYMLAYLPRCFSCFGVIFLVDQMASNPSLTARRNEGSSLTFSPASAQLFTVRALIIRIGFP